MSQQKKLRHLGSSMTVEPTPLLLQEKDNRTEAQEVRFTPSAKTVSTKHSMTNLKPKLSSPISSDSENATIAANILTATLPTLISAGLVQKMRHESGNMVLVFPSTLWTDEIRLK